MKKRHIILTLLLPLLTACQDDLASQATDGGGASAFREEVYVSLSVSAGGGAASRAVGSPQPGEKGDGEQAGTEEENAVYDLNVFFFKGKDTTAADDARPGINSTEAGNIEVVTFYTDHLVKVDNRYVASAQEVAGLELNQTYDVLVLANYGQKYTHTSGELNLAALRDLTAENALTEDGKTSGNTRRFLMASAQAGDCLTLDGKNDQLHPAEVHVDLERLAARVDYRVEEEYDVVGHEGDKVKLTHAVLANDYIASEYLFKRVTESTTSTDNIIYLGNEEVDNAGKASNYVLDPKTLYTGEQAKNADDFRNYFHSFNLAEHDNWTALTAATSEEEGTDEVYHFLSYTHENVATVDVGATTPPSTATCVVFKATYTPAGIEEGRTFYWYNDKGYASIKDIQQDKSLGLVDADITEDNLTDFGILKYENGVCYYTYYIRHADDGAPAAESPMEHAIVRNNLYRLKVNSVSGPGGAGELVVIVTIAPWKEDINVYPEF